MCISYDAAPSLKICYRASPALRQIHSNTIFINIEMIIEMILASIKSNSISQNY